MNTVSIPMGSARPAALGKRLGAELLAFAWSEWGQMGVPARRGAASPWAQDPEALAVFTLEVARDDPRLLEELRAWMLANRDLVSARRLRTMCVSPEDRTLLEQAALDGPRAAAGRGQGPDLARPINLAFRLRRLLGVSARAEVLRHLLALPGDGFETTQVLAGSAGYARRNVLEALGSLEQAGAVEMRTSAGAQRWRADRERWAGLLAVEVEDLPIHRAWPPLLAGLRAVLRWLADPRLEELSAYMLASGARDLLGETRAAFGAAGVRVGEGPVEDAWRNLERLLRDASALLDPQAPGELR